MECLFHWVKLFMPYAAHPVDVAAFIIIGVVRAEVSSELKYNVMIGCVIANMVLAVHGLPVIRPHDWIVPEFQEQVSIFASSDETRDDLKRIRFQEMSDYLSQYLTQLERFCHGCGIDRSKLKTPLRVCSGCKMADYCSVSCQRTDWTHHRMFCESNNPNKSKKQQ
jgi:hypothetical protein